MTRRSLLRNILSIVYSKIKIFNFIVAAHEICASGLPDVANARNAFLRTDSSSKSVETNSLFYNPDGFLTVPQLVTKYGYNAETHTVNTTDGFILEMHRVRSYNRTVDKKFPVLIMHGILCSSSDFVIPGPKRGLAYVLADQGYDVWLANARGNKYSYKHEFLQVGSKEYWDFSFHEIGVFDIPANIDYILNATGKKQVYYIGHSQGTIVSYVMASEVPQYSKKIRSAFYLSPIGDLKNMQSGVLNVLTRVTDELTWILSWIGEYGFTSSGTLAQYFKTAFCNSYSFVQSVCSISIFIVCGYSEKQMDRDLLEVITGHLPAGASFKQLRHFAQIRREGRIQKFNYGSRENSMKYLSELPPAYNLDNVSFDVHMFYSPNDLLAHPKDVHNLHTKIANSYLHELSDKEFNHLDFVFGRDAKTVVYDDLIKILFKYEDNDKPNFST